MKINQNIKQLDILIAQSTGGAEYNDFFSAQG